MLKGSAESAALAKQRSNNRWHTSERDVVTAFCCDKPRRFLWNLFDIDMEGRIACNSSHLSDYVRDKEGGLKGNE